MEEANKFTAIYDVSKWEYWNIWQQTIGWTVQWVVEDKIICLKWLSVGKAKNEFNASPDFMVKDRLDFPIFEPSWTADDELRLLDGVAKAGIDNWFEVHIKYLHNKSAEEIEAHFYSFYNINK